MDTSEPIVIPAIMMSDQVIREAGTNKISLIGVFSVWNASQFPFTAPPFFITPTITNFRNGESSMELNIKIEMPNGHPIWSMMGNIGFLSKIIPDFAVLETPVPVLGATFPSAGRYIIKVLLDGDPVGTRDFRVLPVTATAEPNQPHL
jgi:hypothetical protein